MAIHSLRSRVRMKRRILNQEPKGKAIFDTKVAFVRLGANPIVWNPGTIVYDNRQLMSRHYFQPLNASRYGFERAADELFRGLDRL